MFPLLQVQATLAPDFLKRLLINVETAIELAKELHKFEDLFNRYDQAATHMVAAATLDGQQKDFEYVERITSNAKATFAFIGKLYLFIGHLEGVRNSLLNTDPDLSTLQIKYSALPSSKPETTVQADCQEEGGCDEDLPY